MIALYYFLSQGAIGSLLANFDEYTPAVYQIPLCIAYLSMTAAADIAIPRRLLDVRNAHESFAKLGYKFMHAS